MKKVINAAITVAMATMLMTGCAVKNEDSLGTKVAKHTMNSPLYVVAGTGLIIESTIRGTLVGGAKMMGAKETPKN